MKDDNDDDDEQQQQQQLQFSSKCPALSTACEQTRRVRDADEETFLLYTLSAAKPDRIGLGQLEGRLDSLKIEIDLQRIDEAPRVQAARKGDANESNANHVGILLHQNITSLRSTRGDTGSVAWRSSVYLAQKMLYDLDRSGKVESDSMLFFSDALLTSNVIELSSGTGVLPALLFAHPKVKRSNLQWLATDQEAIMPLLQKNLKGINARDSTARVGTHALDWNDFAIARTSYREQLVRQVFDAFPRQCSMVDFVFATDCIFNAALFGPFLDTLTLLCTPRHTLAVITCELREAEMMQTFIHQWITHAGSWCINTVESQDCLGSHLSKGSVIWLAWRR